MCLQAANGAGSAAAAAGVPSAAAVAPQGEPVSLAGVYTLPSDGAATAQAAYGNVFVAGKISVEAIRAKSYSGSFLSRAKPPLSLATRNVSSGNALFLRSA